MNLNHAELDRYAIEAEGQYMVSLTSKIADIRERMQDGVSLFGDPLPWKKTHDNFRFRPGEVTVWAGINGHGKSLVTSQVATHLIKHRKTLIASLEMPVAATGARMVRQVIGNPNPTEQFIRRAVSWISKNLTVYDQLDTVPARRIIGMCAYAIQVLHVEHIVIDSLMKCGIRSDDFDAQESFVDRLCFIAKHYGVHIHLVHHMRKGASEHDEPNKFDLKGSGGISDLVDNVIIVHRNKRKEAKVNNGDPVEDKVPDTTLTVAKQRHGEWEGKIYLWFHLPSNQFVPSSNSKPDYFELNIDDLIDRAQA